MADIVVNSTTTSTNSNFRFINSYSKQGLRSSKDTLRRDVRSYVARSVNGGGTNNESGKGGGVIFDVEITSLGDDDDDEDGPPIIVNKLSRKNKRRSVPAKKTSRVGCQDHGRCNTTLLNREESSQTKASSESSQSQDRSTDSKSNTPPRTDSSANSAIVPTINNTTTAPKPNNTVLVPTSHHHQHHHTPPPIHRLSTYTSTPIAHLTMYHLPWVKTVVQNYFTNMDMPFPELDDGSPRPVVRTHWLPMCIQHPAIFQVIVCFAATAYAVYQPNYDMLKATVLQVKAQALAYLMREIRRLNERKAALAAAAAAAASQRSNGSDETAACSSSSSSVPRVAADGEVSANSSRQPAVANTSRRRTTTVRAADNIEEDCLIAAVVKMASYEAIFGDAPAYHIHMTFLTHLLSIRSPPGLASLSQDGVLARLLRYVDTNSAHLLNTKLYLVDGEFGGVCLPRQYPLQMRRWSELEAEKVRREVSEGRFRGLCGTGGG